MISRSSTNQSIHRLLSLFFNWLPSTHCISLTTFSNAKLNRIRDNVSTCFNLVSTERGIDIVLSTLTELHFLHRKKTNYRVWLFQQMFWEIQTHALCCISSLYECCSMLFLNQWIIAIRYASIYLYIFWIMCPIINIWSIVDFLLLRPH